MCKNVEFSLYRKKYTEAERRQIAKDHIDLVKLTGFERSGPNLLSGGIKQRVAIAKAFAMQSDVLLMDELLSSLDGQTRRHLDAKVLDIWKKERKTVILVTHSINEALLLATRIIMLTLLPRRISLRPNIRTSA